jgi:hypothetical protein
MSGASPKGLTLTQDQQNVLAWLEAGHNVFLTGVAGRTPQ